MAIRLINHVAATSATNTAFTTPAMNTTGADFLVITMANYRALSEETITDSLSNTWTKLTAQLSTSQGRMQIIYATNPTVGSAQTFSSSVNVAYSSMTVMAFKGVATTTPFDQQNGAFSGSSGQTSIATGSITPTQDNELIIVGWCHSTAAVPVIANASLIGLANEITYNPVNNFAQGGGYGIQGTAAAVNITLTLASVNQPACAIASFKAA